MDYGTQSYNPYDEPYTRPPERINYFAWTVAILLLIGLALAAWLGSFYIFNQPERPDSYRILQKLHKVHGNMYQHRPVLKSWDWAYMAYRAIGKK